MRVKNHLIAGLCGVGKNFPNAPMVPLPENTQIILNILRSEISNPKRLENGIGGFFIFQPYNPSTPRHQSNDTQETGDPKTLGTTWGR